MSSTSSKSDSSSTPPSGGWGVYIKEVFNGLKSLATGLRRTLYYFSHHKEIITQEYPDNRETMNLPERFKGEVIMLHDENSERLAGFDNAYPVLIPLTHQSCLDTLTPTQTIQTVRLMDTTCSVHGCFR